MELLSRTAINQADDVVFEIVDTPRWNGKVRVRGLTSTERDAWESGMVKEVPVHGRPGKTKSKMDTTNLRASLVVRCCVDNEGNRIFTDADAPWLGQKSADMVDRVFEVAKRLSGISDGDLEELEGNSPSAPSDNSSAS